MDDKIIIRLARPEDAGELLAIYAPYVEETAVTFECSVPTAEEFRQRIVEIQKKYPYLVAELDGEAVGYAYASAFKGRAAYDWSVESSVYVRRDKKRLGIGRKLYEELEKCLSAQGIRNINACIACPEREDEYLTADSIRFHEKLGFASVGIFHSCACKFGRWYNMTWMEKHIGAHEENPDPIIPFPDVKS